MSKMLDPKTMDVWISLRDELRRLRGMNLWRGNETLILGKQQLRLMQESRGSMLATRCYILHLTETHESLWAEMLPSGQKLAVHADFEGDWRAWLAAIVTACRGGAYLHTASGHADYRHPQN